LLAFHNIPDAEAINIYMSDANTRGSVSRPFFYHMTTPSLLYPEDTPVYSPPPAALPALSEHHAEPQMLPPSIQLPADFFTSPPRIPDENEAQAPGIVPREDVEDVEDVEDGEDGPNDPMDVDEDGEDVPNDPMDVDEEY
jgi:hypothetical protein